MRSAEWVNGARRAAGLSQRELAERAGVPQPTIARIEAGKQVPRADTLARILDAAGFSIDVVPKRGRGEDRSLIQSWVRLPLPERVRRLAAYGNFGDRLRRARPVRP